MTQTNELEIENPYRLRWQFRIRTLLVLVFLSSFFALAGSYAYTSFEQEKIVNKLGRKGILYDYEYKDGETFLDQSPAGPKWIKRRFGPNFFSRVTYVKLYRQNVENIESIYYLHDLEFLSLFDCDTLRDLKYIHHFGKLKHLDLGDCDGLKTIDPLRRAISLEYLDLFSCENVSDASCLASLERLKYLDISNCGEISEFEFFYALKNLETLKFAKSSLTDVSCFANNLQLRELHLEGSLNLESLDGLEGLPELHLVNVRKCDSLSKSEVDRFLALSPETIVVSDF